MHHRSKPMQTKPTTTDRATFPRIIFPLGKAFVGEIRK